MDKKAIKNFAIEARKSLISGVSTKLSKLGITENGIEEATRIDNDLIEIQSTGARFSGKEVASRAKLVTEFQKREIQGQKYELAFETLIEEVAYTWFNRIIAIRFMEVNDYLPDRLRVLSSETSGKKEPDVITALLDTGLYEALDHESKERVTELLTDGSADAVDELYQLVFIKQCNSLNAQLPDLFERIEDYTELLITISYIDENGVIASLLTIPESDFDVRQEGQIEIIGWMYQYYNTEPKDKVFARGSRKIRADEIPAATQLFTPDWIVRYMVENSLGRYYIDQKLANPLEERSEKEIADAFGWKYYLPTAGQPEDVQLQIQDERKKKSVFALQELKLLDNAMGSGHILVYAFDVFIELYKAEGYSEREAAELTMTHNLFGLEIDKRAYQLAYFAIMMKGHQYNRRIFSKNVKLNLHHFVNSDNIPDEYFERLEEFSELSKPVFTSKLANFKAKIGVFKHANEIGSVLNLTDIKRENIENLRQFINVFDEFTNTDILYALPETHKQINDVLDVMEIMATKYEAIVTNPPYLNKMSATLDKYVKDTYPDVKTDLFSVFIKMNSNLLVKGGYAGFMTPFVWMFIKSYEELRNFLIANKSISSLIQMEYSAFEEATVPVCCFTVKNARTEKVGNYFKLSDFRGGMKVQEEKVLEAIQDSSLDYFYQADQTNFQKIPGSPISYWV
ncbi:BREX-1 system adenine-specific DNA-methyltransferase PglX, partial [Lactococcus cremoris]|uniref:BREX-1 system adenine-specific DNA-methyltransferase PglX n=1 Tax=Lactococcus lactis subsp. cremoris TaxID=1359 RepID=UPI000BDEC14F